MLFTLNTIWKWINGITSKLEKLLITDAGPNKDSYCLPSCSMTAIFLFALMSAHLFSLHKGAACAIVILFISPLWAIEAFLYSRED